MKTTLYLIAASMLATPVNAQDKSAFTTGPVFADFGPHASVDQTDPLPENLALRHSFDVADAAEDGHFNRGFESAARFVNMHAANGVNPDRIDVAVVVHGRAVQDLLTDEAWASRDLEGETNPGGPHVRAMLDAGVRFIVCGQSAAGLGVASEDLIPGVEIALSAMTAHALLQQQGYTVNPF